MPMDKKVLDKIKISTYHGIFEESPETKAAVLYLGSYGSNKARVIAETKKKAKALSKEHGDCLVAWKVIVNSTLKTLIDEGKYKNGKIFKQ